MSVTRECANPAVAGTLDSIMSSSPATARVPGTRTRAARWWGAIAIAAALGLSACSELEQQLIATFEIPMPPEYEDWIVRAAATCPAAEITPALLAAQIATESKFDVNAVSHRDAQGPAQFIPGTWDIWGMDADGDGMANPFSIPDATFAQAAFLCDNHRRATEGVATGRLVGDPVNLALAGYNAGWGAVERAGGIPSGGEFTTETRPYIERIRAREAHYAWLNEPR